MRVWLLCLIALFQAGCTGFQTPSVVPALGPPLPRFGAEGRISLRQGERSDHLRFRWEHAPESDVVLLMSPLGQGLAELTRDAAGARLVWPDKATVAADTLPQLVQRVVGTPLPLEVMADWLRGARPDLSGEAEGWSVVIGDTSAYRHGHLVRILEARREDVELKLIVDDWDVPE